jgi:DNA repair protein RadC
MILKAVKRAALRLIQAEIDGRDLLSCWQALEDYLVASQSRLEVELLRVLFLNSKNRLIADEILGRGTVNRVSVHPREVIRRVIELNAAAIIVVHNHPGGSPHPSDVDIVTTHELTTLAALIPVEVHDHVIVARGKLVSLRRLGLLSDGKGIPKDFIYGSDP